MSEILSKAKEIESKLIKDRRYLHKNAEVGFDLPMTTEYIKRTLQSIGCEVYECGKSGVYTIIGNKKASYCILLRADTDALPLFEESAEEFSSAKNMHACGHDMHTAMLLGAARILKPLENELLRPVKLLFQPAEETLSGAKNMVDGGILEDPKVTAAFMLHVTVGSPLPTGSLIVSSAGVSAPSADYFEIEITGKGCHGAMPNTGIDPITAAAHIITALDTVKTRELSLYDASALTIGSIFAGSAHNIIPDKAIIKGTLRAFDEAVRDTMKAAVVRISKNTAKALKSHANVTFPVGCPSLNNDEILSKKAYNLLSKEIGEAFVFSSEKVAKISGINQKSSGSEDFAFYSQLVPSLMIGISAGSADEGYTVPLHHPKVKLNEDALVYGSAVLATLALKI